MLHKFYIGIIIFFYLWSIWSAFLKKFFLYIFLSFFYHYFFLLIPMFFLFVFYIVKIVNFTLHSLHKLIFILVLLVFLYGVNLECSYLKFFKKETLNLDFICIKIKMEYKKIKMECNIFLKKCLEIKIKKKYF